MKTCLLILGLTAILGIGEVNTPTELGDPPIIIEIEDEEDPSNGNRAPVFVPISGYVESSIGVVILRFSQPCGTVHISFNNLSDGSYYSTSVNGTGAVVIPLTLTSGSWTVTFELSNGTVYNGEFTI